MRADRLEHLVLALKDIFLMILPIVLEIGASLLVDLLFDVEVSFVQHLKIVAQNTDFNLRTIESSKRCFPALNQNARNHHIITWLAQINQVILNNDDN